MMSAYLTIVDGEWTGSRDTGHVIVQLAGVRVRGLDRVDYITRGGGVSSNSCGG